MTSFAFSRSTRVVFSRIAQLVAVAAIATACTEDIPTDASKARAESTSLEKSRNLTIVNCVGDLEKRVVTCGEAATQSSADGNTRSIIIGRQHIYVDVNTSNVAYNAGTGAFTFDVTVRNRIPQPIGTTDGVALHADGVRVFFASGPTTTGGTGMITVVPDGTATFTAPDQPYYQYNTVLDQFELSPSKTWQLNMPNTVTNFAFTLLLNAAVQHPDGYIDLQVANNSVRPPDDKQVSFWVRNAYGELAESQGPLNWTSSDPTRAEVSSTGLIDPKRAGPVTITAETIDGMRVGVINVDVLPIRRTWTASASNTDWHTGGNWSPDNIVPVATDTAVIPSAPAGGNIFPVLNQNTSIGGVELSDAPALISLGAFDLTASGDVAMSTTGAITGSVGRLILTGVARTVNGRAPRVRVTGTYSLDANLTLNNNLRVESGRLRNTGFRIRVTND